MANYLELLYGGNRLLSPEDSGEPVDETAEGGTEDVSDVPEETQGSEATEDALDLSGIPEELHERIRERETLLRGQAESQWTKKFQEQAERLRTLEEKARMVDQFNENFTKDPKGVIEFLRSKVPETSPAPEDPGTPPDPIEDPEAFREWIVKRDAFLTHQIEERVRKQYGDLGDTRTVLQQIQQERALAHTRTAIGASEEEFSEVLRIRDELASDTTKAFKFILETLKMKNGKATHAQEARRGTEERPGLQRSGARKQIPKATGDHMLDALNELEAEGITFPEV